LYLALQIAPESHTYTSTFDHI